MQRTRVGYPGFAGITALNASDAEELFAAALEIGFDGLHAGLRDHQYHADAEVERLQKFVGFDFSDLREIFENRWNGPASKVYLSLNAGRQDARQVAGNTATGDVRQSGNPAASHDIFQRWSVTEVRLEEF